MSENIETSVEKCIKTYNASLLAKLNPWSACTIVPGPSTFGGVFVRGSWTGPSFVDLSDAICSSPKGDPKATRPGEIEPPAIAEITSVSTRSYPLDESSPLRSTMRTSDMASEVIHDTCNPIQYMEPLVTRTTPNSSPVAVNRL